MIQATEQAIKGGEFTEQDLEAFALKGTDAWLFRDGVKLPKTVRTQAAKKISGRRNSLIQKHLGHLAKTAVEYHWLQQKFEKYSDAHAGLDYEYLVKEVDANPYLLGQVCTTDELRDFEQSAKLQSNASESDRERGFVHAATYEHWVQQTPEHKVAAKKMVSGAVAAMGYTGDDAKKKLASIMEKLPSYASLTPDAPYASIPALSVWEDAEKKKWTYPIWALATEKKIVETVAERIKLPHIANVPDEVLAILYTSQLDDTQKHAVRQMYEEPLTLVTGMPGTGKTTMIRTLAAMVKAAGGTIIGMAPTGIAARRIGTAADIHAETIHQYYRIYDEERSFVSQGMLAEHALWPTTQDGHIYLVVDEAGMASLYPLFAVLWGTPTWASTHIILVGDENQLRPVGFGRPYHALVSHPALQRNVVRLMNVYRQGSAAVAKQYLVTGAVDSPLVTKIAIATSEEMRQAIKQWVDTHGGLQNDDWQILSPFRHQRDDGAEFGKDEINQWFDHNGDDGVFHNGQRIVQKKNNRAIGVMNGELGRIVGNEDDRWQVEFQNGAKVSLSDDKALDEWDLAWALTVHKAQGGEWDHVLLVIPPGAESTSLALMYTALTRFKVSMTVIAVNPDAFLLASHAVVPSSRNNLTYRLNRVFTDESNPVENKALSGLLKRKSSTTSVAK